MKLSELNPYTFRALRHSLGHDRPRDPRPMWQQRLSADSDFCRAMVLCGYLTREQMQRAALRYRLGRARDGGVIFWQTDTMVISKTKPRMRHLINVKEPHFFHFEA